MLAASKTHQALWSCMHSPIFIGLMHFSSFEQFDLFVPSVSLRGIECCGNWCCNRSLWSFQAKLLWPLTFWAQCKSPRHGYMKCGNKWSSQTGETSVEARNGKPLAASASLLAYRYWRKALGLMEVVPKNGRCVFLLFLTKLCHFAPPPLGRRCMFCASILSFSSPLFCHCSKLTRTWPWQPLSQPLQPGKLRSGYLRSKKSAPCSLYPCATHTTNYQIGTKTHQIHQNNARLLQCSHSMQSEKTPTLIKPCIHAQAEWADALCEPPGYPYLPFLIIANPGSRGWPIIPTMLSYLHLQKFVKSEPDEPNYPRCQNRRWMFASPWGDLQQPSRCNAGKRLRYDTATDRKHAPPQAGQAPWSMSLPH